MKNENRDAGCLFHFDNVFEPEMAVYGGIELYQIGEISCQGGYEIAPHNQMCLELSCIVSGKGYFRIDDTLIPVAEGDIFLNAVGHVHAISADPASMLRYVYMGFRFNEKADAIFSEIGSYFQSAPYRHARDPYNLLIPFKRNIDEFYSARPGSHTMIRGYLEQILVLAYRTFTETGELSPYAPNITAPSVGHTVYRVIRYVENRLFELTSIKEISEELNYSYTYLSRTFKQKTGMTLQRYINQKKIEKALELLRYGDLTVKETGERLNYETPQSFNKAFVRVMGYPPSHYVAKLRSGSSDS